MEHATTSDYDDRRIINLSDGCLRDLDSAAVMGAAVLPVVVYHQIDVRTGSCFCILMVSLCIT